MISIWIWCPNEASAYLVSTTLQKCSLCTGLWHRWYRKVVALGLHGIFSPLTFKIRCKKSDYSEITVVFIMGHFKSKIDYSWEPLLFSEWSGNILNLINYGISKAGVLFLKITYAKLVFIIPLLWLLQKLKHHANCCAFCFIFFFLPSPLPHSASISLCAERLNTLQKRKGYYPMKLLTKSTFHQGGSPISREP